MKFYLLSVSTIFALAGCSSFSQHEEKNIEVVVAQLCTNNLGDSKVKEITLYPLNLVKGNKNATEKLNSLILPAAPLDMNFVGITPDNMSIYSSVVGNPESLRYVTISEGKEHMSFKRNFTQYNQDWSKWESSDEMNMGNMSKNNKVRFKIVKSHSPIYSTRFINTIPDSCN